MVGLLFVPISQKGRIQSSTPSYPKPLPPRPAIHTPRGDPFVHTLFEMCVLLAYPGGFGVESHLDYLHWW